MTEIKDESAAPGTVGAAIAYCFERLENGEVFFGHGTDNAWDEAVQLVLCVAGIGPDADDSVLPHPLSDELSGAIEAMLQRRIEEQVPLPYLTGSAWFAGLEFACDQRAIIPRSPIAELIINDYQPWYSGPAPMRILDLCCGGGCIGLAAAHYSPSSRVDLVDLDSAALQLAAENRARLSCEARVEIVQSNLFEALGGRRYDLILSNPPYVDAADLAAMPAEYQHEPELALGSGHDGLALTRQILAQAGDYLSEDGLLILEVGNSWEALEQAYPMVPFTWLDFEQGGHGVLALTAQELRQYRESLSQYQV